MVDPLSYFSFQPVHQDWMKQRAWCVLSCLWDYAYNTTLVAYQKAHWIGRKEMFYLMMHSTHFINGYMASDIW